MKEFQLIPPEEFDPVFNRIGKDWMLISASDGTRANTMTASWGGLGVIWHKPVAICVIRPERFTYNIAESSTHLSLSFLPEEYRDALKFCGANSGRDGDKFEGANLTKVETDGVPYPEEAELVLICRKLYADDLRPEAFLDQAPILERFYGEKGGFHRFYVCEIEKVLKKI